MNCVTCHVCCLLSSRLHLSEVTDAHNRPCLAACFLNGYLPRFLDSCTLAGSLTHECHLLAEEQTMVAEKSHLSLIPNPGQILF